MRRKFLAYASAVAEARRLAQLTMHLAMREVSARHRDYARVVAAAVVDVVAGGTCTAATLTMLRVADRPLLLDCTEAVRDGGGVDGLLAGITPPDDVEASGAYRQRVAPVLAARALGEAMAEASA